MKHFAIYIFLLTLMTLSVITSFGQAKDSLKPDTTYLPAYEKLDTARANFICVKIKGHNQPLTYVEQGFIVLKGFAVKKNEKWEWVEQPKIDAAFDARKEKVYKLIQIIQ
jgi:hypothetical protein